MWHLLPPYVFIYLLWKLIKRISSVPNKKTKNIIILGCKESGKTELWSRLGADLKESSKNRTSQQTVSEFTISKNEKTITISETKDIGGGDDWVSTYDELISKGTFIYYLINGHEFEKKSSFKEVKSQIEKISRCINGKENCGLKILITHFDEINITEQELKQKIKQKLENKITNIILKGVKQKITQFLDNNVDFVNLLDEKDINKIKDEILEAL
ncbi:signal recognition particle receptor beta subunit [Prevotella sp. ICM33]|jgi:hypothetical protein|uniref:hypothetical protein n=1 Tax=Prevotella sp. ICM33 TaxID=1161412 RepID=UPI00044D0B81|nr:hypothetical protein [Prevotella sp. ICM33]ETS96261.1 signal recognition particle receptor beta subunit [Prevotella sp. ICM33]